MKKTTHTLVVLPITNYDKDRALQTALADAVSSVSLGLLHYIRLIQQLPNSYRAHTSHLHVFSG